jgi:hypothetical protein
VAQDRIDRRNAGEADFPAHRHLLREHKESRMSPTDILNLISGAGVADRQSAPTRRALLLASLFAGLPLVGAGTAALASPLDPSQTAITLPDAISFVPWSGAPPRSGAMATLSAASTRRVLIWC